MRDRNRLSLGQGIPVEIEKSAIAGRATGSGQSHSRAGRNLAGESRRSPR
jgi:hypothetical protein